MTKIQPFFNPLICALKWHSTEVSTNLVHERQNLEISSLGERPFCFMIHRSLCHRTSTAAKRTPPATRECDSSGRTTAPGWQSSVCRTPVDLCDYEVRRSRSSPTNIGGSPLQPWDGPLQERARFSREPTFYRSSRFSAWSPRHLECSPVQKIWHG